MRPPNIIYADADDFANNSDPAIVFLQISKESIESGNISSTLEKLHVLTDSAENARLYRDSLVLLVEGFDSDPRELMEIAEVRLFFHRLTEDWPHWFWYLNREMGGISLVVSLLCEIRGLRKPSGIFSELVSKKEAEIKFHDLLTRGGALYMAYGISPMEVEESTESALRGLFRSA